MNIMNKIYQDYLRQDGRGKLGRFSWNRPMSIIDPPADRKPSRQVLRRALLVANKKLWRQNRDERNLGHKLDRWMAKA